MKLTAIMAISDDGVVGVDGPNGPALPWRLPPDLRRFKMLTTGHAIIMGRRTYESIGRALPGRRNVVLTTTIGGEVGLPGCLIAHNPDAALFLVREVDPEPFVIGGPQTWHVLWPHVTHLELTHVRTIVGFGSIFDLALEEWRETAREPHLEHEGLGYEFGSYVRRSVEP